MAISQSSVVVKRTQRIQPKVISKQFMFFLLYICGPIKGKRGLWQYFQNSPFLPPYIVPSVQLFPRPWSSKALNPAIGPLQGPHPLCLSLPLRSPTQEPF